MMPLVAHELRIATRRASWPVAIGLHLAALTLFVAVWGPTGGVPLWSAPALMQLVAADRVIVAVLLTWLVTPLFAPERGGDITGWSSVTGASPSRVMLSRAACAAALAIVMIVAAVPVTVAAAEMSATGSRTVLEAAVDMAAFALLAIGVTAAASVGWRNQLAVWCASMALTMTAALGVRLLSSGAPRLVACLAIAAAGVAAASGIADRRWRWIEAEL